MPRWLAEATEADLESGTLNDPFGRVQVSDPTLPALTGRRAPGTNIEISPRTDGWARGRRFVASPSPTKTAALPAAAEHCSATPETHAEESDTTFWNSVIDVRFRTSVWTLAGLFRPGLLRAVSPKTLLSQGSGDSEGAPERCPRPLRPENWTAAVVPWTIAG